MHTHLNMLASLLFFVGCFLCIWDCNIPFGPDRLRKVIIIILVTVVWFLFIRLLGVWGEVIRWNRVSFTSLNRESAREEKPD